MAQISTMPDLVVEHLPVDGLAAATVSANDIPPLYEHTLPDLEVAPSSIRRLVQVFWLRPTCTDLQSATNSALHLRTPTPHCHDPTRTNTSPSHPVPSRPIPSNQPIPSHPIPTPPIPTPPNPIPPNPTPSKSTHAKLLNLALLTAPSSTLTARWNEEPL